MNSNTIAGIATGMTNSGIGIIRISGEESISKISEIFFDKNGKRELDHYKSHTIHYGFIKEGEEFIDEVMISIMKAPNTYTKEDIVEINSHGGLFVMKKILSLVYSLGIEPAEPGEFTKRAFLNGRIDLSKAEAIMDMITSKNDMALKNSLKQLKGSVSNEIKDMREKILYEIAYIESALDDPEHISLEGYKDHIKEEINKMILEMEKIIINYDKGRILQEGIDTVIMGKPNAGKSSFLNKLSGYDKAIVTEIAGTTRDIIEESVLFGNVQLNLIDTAGIRETEDIVEKIGINKALEYGEKADLIFFIVDSSVELDENDIKILKFLKDKKSIILLNKVDLGRKTDSSHLEEYMKDWNINSKIFHTSFLMNEGLDELEKEVETLFFENELILNEELIITNLRQKNLLEKALSNLKLVIKGIEDDLPEDFLSIDLMSSYTELGLILGEEIGDDLVQEIFSKFCMGK